MPYAFDPEIADIVPMLPSMDGTDPAATRAFLSEMISQLPAPDTAGLHIEDRQIRGGPGDPDVTIRIYRPDQVSAPAAVYTVHGGGFIAGNLDTEQGLGVKLARELGVVVVAVDYRLAPETPFPGPLEDVYAGLLWLSENASELSVDPERIAICGTSAGGGLCAALALLARDRGGPPIAFQFLGVPELDDRLTTASMTTFVDTPLWDRPKAIASWDHYLGPGLAGTEAVSIYAAPARAADLGGLPPAYVSVMHFDPLRDEGIGYALNMLAAGVTVELHLFPGTFHGSAVVQHAAVSQREQAEMLAVLRRGLAL